MPAPPSQRIARRVNEENGWLGMCVGDGLDGVGLDSVDGSRAAGSQAADALTLAALVMPATVDHIRVISEHGERMPAKSTYFYPKLLTGLVINPLE